MRPLYAADISRQVHQAGFHRGEDLLWAVLIHCHVLLGRHYLYTWAFPTVTGQNVRSAADGHCLLSANKNDSPRWKDIELGAVFIGIILNKDVEPN